MSDSKNFVDELASSFLIAEGKHQPIEQVTARYPNLTLAEAYQVQTAIVNRLVKRGERVVGKKVAATSDAAQQMLGLAGPAYGHLLESQRVVEGGEIPVSELINPRVECEITFLLKKNLIGPGVTVDNVLAATESVMASLEIVDLRARDWNVGAHEVVAYNGLAARYVLGPEPFSPAEIDLPNVSVSLKKNGEHVATATGTAVLGNPAQGIVWLANKLAEQGSHLSAGEIIMTGSLTPPQPVSAGDRFEAVFQRLGAISIRFG